MTAFSTLTPDDRGLVPAIVQDDRTGTVLMIAFMNEEAFDATADTGFVHFWSRSRSELWKKGATSGNTLRVVSVTTDCDRDAVLVRAVPAGPVCHTGADTCFGPARDAGIGTAIDELASIIADRQSHPPEGSYTARLLADRDLAARKVLEEAGEVAFAARDVDHGGSRQRLVEEAIDELYHLLVLTAAHGVTPAELATEIEARMLPEDRS